MKNLERDLLILSHLRRDARVKLTKLSRATRIPVSTLFDKIKAYQVQGVLKKNASLVDFGLLGYQARALILLSAHKKDRAKLGEVLRKSKSVNSLFKVNNGWDFSVEVVFPGMKEVEEFIEGVEEQVSLKGKSVFYVIEELKREAFLSNPALVGI
ncbi:MAG: Lrp/AsnC family transcriptional regulator [Desulforudis sp.]|jgi:DNA-binding Lrp family transcriptional regulator|nr:MAG: Lrp/AsnC family transcriptional regulator [Desulforudis sp.]